MRDITDVESNTINSATYTHDFEDSYVDSNSINDLQDRFEREFTDYDACDDLGGIAVYFKQDKLVAFYDYEQFKGAVF